MSSPSITQTTRVALFFIESMFFVSVYHHNLGATRPWHFCDWIWWRGQDGWCGLWCWGSSLHHLWPMVSFLLETQFLVGGVSPPKWKVKHMRKSNWIISTEVKINNGYMINVSKPATVSSVWICLTSFPKNQPWARLRPFKESLLYQNSWCDSIWIYLNGRMERGFLWKAFIFVRKTSMYKNYGPHWLPCDLGDSGVLNRSSFSGKIYTSSLATIIAPPGDLTGYPWTPKPWKMKVLNPQYMVYNP